MYDLGATFLGVGFPGHGPVEIRYRWSEELSLTILTVNGLRHFVYRTRENQ